MSKVVTLKIEEELLEKAKKYLSESDPIRYPDTDDIKYAATAREALIFFIKEKSKSNLD